MQQVLIGKRNAGNLILRNMVLDTLIVRFAINGKSLPSNIIKDFEYLISVILKQNSQNSNGSSSTEEPFVKSTAVFHPNIIWNFNLVQLSMEICQSTNINTTLAPFVAMVNKSDSLAIELQLFMRSILLSSSQLELSFDNWEILFDRLTKIVRSNSDISSDAIYMVLYHLAKETNANKQLELLRGLVSFATLKTNVPMILNAFRSLTSSSSISLRVLAIDLHTRLWMTENRTYRFLHDIVTADDGTLSKKDQWEMNVAKAKAIKEICTKK